MTRILSTDLLIADVIAPVAAHESLSALAQEFGMQRGNKRSLTDAEAARFADAFKQVEVGLAPGGSSANVLSCISQLLGKAVEVKFVGVAGEGAHGDMIRAALKEANITLMPEHVPQGVRTREATSYVLVYSDAQCSIATHPGNARQVLKPALLPEHVVEHCEVVLAQGSLWHKFHPEFADRLYHLCVKHHRALWLTLPTQAHATPNEYEKIREMIPYASLVFGNEAELVRMFNMPLPEAIKQLQRLLRVERGSGPHPVGLGYITLGAKGCILISRDSVEQMQAVPVPPELVKNTIGAGDTAYAGFAAGYLQGMPLRQAAHLGMVLASEKLRVNAPRLPQPLACLKQVAPDLAAQLA